MYNRYVHHLSISLFGSPQIKRGNQELIIQRRKDLALLIYLVVTSQPHRRDTLATLLWEDQDQAEARSNIRKSLSRLKSILGEDVLLIAQDKVWINPKHPIDLDIAQFHSRLQQVHQHRHARSDAKNALRPSYQTALEEAAAYYRADFLSGFSVPDSSVFEEWQFFQAESLRTNLAEVLEQLTDLYASSNDHEKAIETCRRWLALDRLNESAQRQLMQLYAASGQRAAAIRQFQECQRLLKEELDAEPEEETLQLFHSIQKKKNARPPAARDNMVDAAQPVASAAKHPHLPVHPAPFIGRENELREIIRILRESPDRLVTLLGPGGSGKTRLALQVGAELSRDAETPLRDEIWFVPLAPVADPRSIINAIAQSLGMAGSGSNAHEAVLGALRGRELLLILDNFEHLLNADSVRLVTDLLSASARLRILLTSRERLNLEGEHVFPVGGLEIPSQEALHSSQETDPVFTGFSALQLFEQCASRVQPGFKISSENYRAIIDICGAVQGMPLAIELAASWVEVYSPHEIHQEILRSLDFLQSNWRDLPDRQRSLRAVFDSSWSLLEKTNRPVIKALSVFRSSFTREAAQAISGASTKTLLDLNHKSWIQRLPSGRYQIHELLRQFAFEKLKGEQTTYHLVMKQYSHYYAGYTAGLWKDMKGVNQRRAFSGMDTEFDNIHVAWLWLVSMKETETAVHSILPILFHYAELRVKGSTLLEMLEMALASLPDSGPRQDLSIIQQEIILRSVKGAFWMNEALRASIPDVIFPIDRRSIRRAWTLAQKHKVFEELGFWGILLSYIYGRLIQYDGGVRQLERLLPFFKRTDQKWELAISYLHLLKLLVPNEPDGSRRRGKLTAYLSGAREIFNSLGDEINTANILNLWGNVKFQQEDIKGAIQQWQVARNSFLNSGEWAAGTAMLWQLCDAYLQIGYFQKAFDGYREIGDTFHQRGLRLLQASALSKESFEKVRHGDIEDALQIRRRCLDISLETGDIYQIAWNYWELGEVLRVMGNSAAASEAYERSYQIFDQEQDAVGRAYYFRGIGDIVLEKKDYESARDQFLTSVQLVKSVNHTWMVCYTFSKLARTQLELQDLKSANKSLHAAFQSGLKTFDQGVVLVTIGEYAEFCVKLGRYGKAVVLCSLVNNHVASWHETRQHSSMLLDSLRKQMSAEKYAQYRSKGCDLDLWRCVKTSLQELESNAATSPARERATRRIR